MSQDVSPLQAKAKSGPLILYVDDERPNRVVFEQGLPEFNIKTVASGAAALELLEQHEVAVVVSDMRMAGMSGEELLRTVKERHPRAIRIVVTAYSDSGPILRAVNEGLVARYIVKPWERTEMAQVLRWACEAWVFSRDSAALHHRLMETERLATLGSFASMLVHDLKQPLMSLLINIDHLREARRCGAAIARSDREVNDDRGSLQKPRLDRLVADLDGLTSDLKTSGGHLSDLVNSLRDMGRSRENGTTSHSTDPLPIVRHAMAVCHQLALNVRATIDYLGPRALPPVRINGTELMQVLVNVVANGAQAVAARGGAHGKVQIMARDVGPMLELEIRDDGVGMARDVLDRAGTPFFTTRTEGTGLGIAQCQRLVGTAGGQFKIESQAGVGTTVTITLPTAPVLAPS